MLQMMKFTPKWAEAERGDSGRKIRTSGQMFGSMGNGQDSRYGLKLNTMVNSQNINSDMSDLVRRLSPTRWKIFQFLHIIGENDSAVSNGVGAEEFRNFVTRHKKILEDTEIGIISEENREMLGSYAMIDPTGKAYTNISGRYHYSSLPIHEVGFLVAWADVCDGFDNFIFKSGAENGTGILIKKDSNYQC